jgi:hypothetical protein
MSSLKKCFLAFMNLATALPDITSDLSIVVIGNENRMAPDDIPGPRHGWQINDVGGPGCPVLEGFTGKTQFFLGFMKNSNPGLWSHFILFPKMQVELNGVESLRCQITAQWTEYNPGGNSDPHIPTSDYRIRFHINGTNVT